MLLLVAFVIVLICFLFTIGLEFTTLLGQHSRSQYNVDALALQMAKTLNDGDRVGQMNQLVARNRELIFTTRQDALACEQEGLGHLSQLCDQLVDEAYSSHDEIEHERMNQIAIVSKEIRKAARDYNQHKNKDNNSWFPWMQTFEPEVTRVDVGCLKNVQSNVKSGFAVEELAEYDRQKGYVEPKSELFRAGVNARLPAPDERLDFKFSALPAFVKNTIAPPRVANIEKFEQYPIVIRDASTGSRPNDRMPYAVRLNTSMDVALDAEQLSRHSVNISTIGVAGGAISDYE